MDQSKIHQEYQKLIDNVGFWVQSPWKVMQIIGKDRIRFLQNLLSQHIEEQVVGEKRWAGFLNAKGKVIGFFQVWKLDEKILLIVHQSQKAVVDQELQKYWITEDIEMKWLDEVQVVSVFGSVKERFFEEYSYQTNQIVEGEILRCSVDDFFIPSVQMILWPDQKLVLSKINLEIKEALFESIRIQSKIPLPKKDYDETIVLEIPFMHRGVSFNKGCYVGQETIARLHARGLHVSKKLLQGKTKHNVQPQDTVMLDGVQVGTVTSVAPSPIENGFVSLVWIHRNAFGKQVTVNGNPIEVEYE